MAWTVASALDQKAWAKETTFEAERKTFFKKFHGTLVKTYKDLVKNAGDTIYVPMVQRIKGAGLGAGSGVTTGLATTDSIGADTTVGNTTFGNETPRIMGYDGSSSYAAYDNLVYRYDEIKLAQKRNAIRSPGTFFHQQGGFNFREHAKHVLANWKAEIVDHIHFRHLAGMTNFVWPETASAPSTSATYAANRRLYGGNATSEATIGTDDFFTTEEIDRLRTLAKLAEPRIMPYKASDGKEYFVLVIHPYQAHTLRQDSNWKQAHYYADVRGEDNAIFSGALGIWNGVIKTQPCHAGYMN